MDKINDLIESVQGLDINRTKAPRGAKKRPIKPWAQPGLKTGLIFDELMAKHECMWLKADECPGRYHTILDRFKQYNYLEKCEILEPAIATKEQILLCHDEQYYELVKSTQGDKDVEKQKQISSKYDGVYFNEHTYDAAMMAAGSSIKLADAILDRDEIRNAFALVRPPGHHAQKADANGYCIFNNAAIVAKHCVKNRGLERILIVDWDVHHGQGTQSFFYNDPNVLYVSIHRYEKGKYWPELIESNFNFTGMKSGKGFNINFPLNEVGCNDRDFYLMWHNVIMPVAYEFNPELVIISAGFDAAFADPEGRMRVQPVTFSNLCQSLMSLADGKVLALLEGGYHLNSMAESAAWTLRALLGFPSGPIDDLLGPPPGVEAGVELHESVIQTVLDVIWAIRPRWKMLRLQGSFARFQSDPKSSPGGDVDQRPNYSPVATYEGTASYSETKPTEFDVMEGLVCPRASQEELQYNDAKTDCLIANTDKGHAVHAFKKRTLLLFDDNMARHKCQVSHPEKPARYTKIKERLQETGLFDRCSIGRSRRASEEEILAVHSEELLNLLKKTPNMGDKELLKLGNSMDSIYINQSTYDCALLAAGCAIEAVDKVMSRAYTNAFALIRPPGHHADRDTAAGFCFFNNVVVAASYALKRYPETCKRILIVDYDFHHGNGVQRLVEGQDEFLYISLHGYNDANEYPMDQYANYNTGHKNVINIPWNDDRMGDPEYILALFTIVMPCAHEFNPDLVLVSSGFDAAINDPLGGYTVSPAAFGHMVYHLQTLAQGKLVACLEGGYNLESISESSAHVVSVLLGDMPQSLTLRPPSAAAVLSMKNVISYHKSNYKQLSLDHDLPDDEVE